MPKPFRPSLVRAFCCGLLLAAAPWVHAVGLGDIKLNSALGDRLDAELRVTGLDSLSIEQLKVELGDAAAYADRGFRRTAIHSAIRLELTAAGDGEAKVSFSSSRPITEPMLPLVVVVRWPSGTLSKDFTLLLDPR